MKTLEGASLEWKDSVKNLGVILDSKLLFKQNVGYNMKKARKAVSILYCLLKRSSHVQRLTEDLILAQKNRHLSDVGFHVQNT